MPHRAPRNPLHGITLEAMLNALVAKLGWEAMGREVAIRCFTHDPSIGSSLQFLRRTPWARAKVEQLYIKAVVRGDGAPGSQAGTDNPSAPQTGTGMPSAAGSKFLGPGGKDRSALKAHLLNRSHAHHKSDNRAKV